MKKKIVIISIIIALILITILSIVLISNKDKKMSSLELQSLKDKSEEISNYLEYIDTNENEEIVRYISFAIETDYQTDNKGLDANEISNIINNYFTKEYSEEEIMNFNLNPLLMEKNIFYEEGKFKKIYERTPREISIIPIVKYIPREYKKINDKKYTVEFEKYEIENPYEVFNYFEEYNNKTKYDIDEYGMKNEKDYDERSLVDIDKIKSYLEGKGKVIELKKLLNENNIDNMGNSKKKVKVYFTMKDEKLLIEKIETI